MARIRILGPVEVWTDGQRVELGGPRQISLLVLLALQEGRSVSSDVLVGALWGDERSQSRKGLQMAISRLRRVLAALEGPDGPVLRTVGGGYALVMEPEDLDATVFEQLVARGMDALVAGRAEQAVAELSEALELWRGPVLSEVAYEDCVQSDIRRLEELQLVATEELIQAELQLGRHQHVIAQLQTLCQRHPDRERLAGQLMLALYRSGRQAEALDAFGRIRTHLARELGLEPGPALAALQAEILDHAASLDLGAPRTGPDRAAALPIPPTPIIGRERHLPQVVNLLSAPGQRLVTLIGPGGVGKTRMAIAAAAAAAASFSDGACWVELAGVSRGEDVAPAVARALGVVVLQGETTEAALRRDLASQNVLVILDNFEHVLEATVLVSELVRACSRLVMFVTSRERLDLAAETLFWVEPLDVHSDPAQATVSTIELIGGPALFVAAARRHDAGFRVLPEQAPVIAHICARLDGLPLALELAAARASVQSIEKLAVGLDDALRGLGSGPRDAPARQRTLGATIDWSYRLLDPALQSVFRRFAAFAGGATIDAACQVLGVTVEQLETLVAKSLLMRRRSPDSGSRIVMLETVRQYAATAMTHGDERLDLARRHAAYYADLVVGEASRLATEDEREALGVIESDLDNLTAALRYLLMHAPAEALRLAGYLGHYWYVRGDPTGLRWLDAALRAAGDDAPVLDRAHAQRHRCAQLGAFHVRTEEALRAAQTAVSLYRESGDETGFAHALCDLSIWAGVVNEDIDLERQIVADAVRHARLAGDDHVLGRTLAAAASNMSGDEQRETLHKATELLVRVGDHRELARALSNASYVCSVDGRPQDAVDLIERARQTIRRVDSPFWTMIIVGNAGLAHVLLGDRRKAAVLFQERLQICVRHGFIESGEAIIGTAALAAQNGWCEDAAALRGAAAAMGYPPSALDAPIAERIDGDFLAPARGRCGDLAWQQAEQAGRTLNREQAVARAVAVISSLIDAGVGANLLSDYDAGRLLPRARAV